MIWNVERKSLFKEEDTLKLVLMYIQGVIDKITIILRKKEIFTSFKPPNMSIRWNMKSAKEPIYQHHHKGVFKIPCFYGKLYIGEIVWCFILRIKEYEDKIRLEHFHMSTLIEHSYNTKHQLFLGKIKVEKIIAKKNNYSICKFR